MSIGEAPPQAGSSKSIYVLWAVGFGLLAVLGLFCWLFLGPVMKVRALTQEIASSKAIPKNAIERLGGEQEAGKALTLYFSLPKRYSPNRWEACWLLGRCDRYALPAVRLALKDDDRDVRRTALQVAANLGPLAAPLVPEIAALVDAPDTDVRVSAVNALGTIGPEPRRQSRAIWFYSYSPSFWIERQTPKDALPFPEPRAVGEPIDEQVLRQQAAQAATALGRALGDRERSVRVAALESLMDMEGQALPAVPALIRVLKDPDEALRGNAAATLAGIGPGAAEAIPALVKCLSDSVEQVRINAGVALVSIVPDSSDLKGLLKPVLEDASPKVREAVGKALAEKEAAVRPQR